ncbi:MAG: hypothetical protein HC877_18770 [Thioploca sp.]|nr:hypothetical protein [Thioploca sp.]
MNQDYLNLSTDYLSITFGYASATGLSKLLDGEVSHAQFTRFLGSEEFTSKELWKVEGVKFSRSPSSPGFYKPRRERWHFASDL